MHVLWIVLVSFVAGIVVPPGRNEPAGFLLTTALGIVGAFVSTWIGHSIGWYFPDRGAGFVAVTWAPLSCCSSGTA